MKQLNNFKRGDTFAFVAEITDNVTSDPIPGVAAKLKSEVRKQSDEIVATLVVSETVTPGSYLFQCLDTTGWPIGTLYCDIQYTDGDVVSSTETISIQVEKDVTR